MNDGEILISKKYIIELYSKIAPISITYSFERALEMFTYTLY